MADIRDFPERRKHRRFQVRDGILVSTPTAIGEMIDISMGGLSFRFVDEKNITAQQEKAILFGEDEMIFDLPLQVVADYAKEPDPQFVTIRRLSCRFGELSTEQKQQLEDFIAVNALQ